MVYSARNEQRLKFKVLRHHWEPVDLDGITLMRRPAAHGERSTEAPRGWSSASKRRRFAR